MFRNVRFFRLEAPFELEANELEEQLAGRRFRPCGPIEVQTMGWSSPLGGDSEALVHSLNGCLLVTVRKQERLLPASVVAEALDERVAEIEAAEGREVGRTERRRLREDIMVEMLPRAFTRSRRVRAYVDRTAGLAVVDAASEKAAEEVISLLRETLGSFPATPPRPTGSPAVIMTDWVTADSYPEAFVPGDECELRDAQDSKSVVRCRGQDVAGEEIQTHLRAGKQVVKLAVDWDERLSFVLNDDLSLKRLRVADAVIEEAVDDDIEDEAVRFEAEFIMMALQLRELLTRLQDIFGLNSDH